MNNSIPQKSCSKCKKLFPATLEYFRKASKEKSGLTSRCKACLKQWREDHKDSINAQHRDEYANDPEKFRKIGRDYYAKHSEPIKARVKRYRDNNPDKVKKLSRTTYLKNRKNPEWWLSELARVKRYYIEHPSKRLELIRKMNEKHADKKREWARQQYILFPEKARAKSHKRMAMKKAVGGSYTQDDLKHLYEEQEGRCAYCGISIYWSVPRDIHIDHIQPLSRGGTNNPDNLNLTCHSCNESKADNELSDWLLSRGW